MSLSTPDQRVLLVGIDGGCLEVLEPMFERGDTPTIQAIVEDGSSGPLESQIPPWTASAWPTLFTGKNPGKHGVFDFLAFDGYDWDVVNATHVRERPIWELLSEHGIRSVVVNVPVTHPARAFDGALVPGMTAPENPTCHPDGLFDELTAAIGEYRVYPQSGDEPNHSIESYVRTVRSRGDAFQYLLERFDPHFGFLQFQVTDSVIHERPGDEQALRAIYSAVDDEVERAIDTFEPTAVVVVSDHGVGPVSGHEFRVNEFLRQEGYLTARSGGDGMPTWTRAWENDLIEGRDADEHQPGVAELVMGGAARFGLTTQRIANALDHVGLKEPIGRRVPNDLIRAASQQVDFPNSSVYVRSKSELGLRINLEGREPDGIVSRSAYESIRREVIESLRAVDTPDGSPMFDVVEPRETYFDGPHIDEGPDVLLVPAEFDNAIVADLGGDHFGEPVEPWNHKRTGMFAASGTSIDADASIDDASILDVAPTICSLFEIPIDAAMDGDSLAIVDPTEIRSYPGYEPEPAVAIENTQAEDRLSDLGYL